MLRRLECGDLSPLCSVATCRDHGYIERIEEQGRQAALDQSGDRSPHSKNLTENVANLVDQALIFQILIFNYRQLLKKFSLFARQ